MNIVPIFVAVLVWLTHILFIGGLAVAGEQLFGRKAVASTTSSIQPVTMPQTPTTKRVSSPKGPTKKMPAKTKKTTIKRTTRATRKQRSVPVG